MTQIVDVNRSKKATFCDIVKKMALEALIFIRYYFDLFIEFVYGMYYNSSRQFVEQSTNPIILKSASELAKSIRKRKLKSEEVVQAFIDRCKQVNGVLNSVVDERYEEALKEARKIDKAIETGQIQEVDFQIQPFLGVPFTTKESTACKGMSSTFGIQIRKHRKAKEDAEVVELMKKAGGILIGVTNIPPLNLWFETTNSVFGTTNNPYNTVKNVGGSSGGEASLLAAGGTPLGIGTDIGGSIRIPAFSCGVFGHKPTSHLISTRGLTFRTGNEKDTIVAAGPMTRYAEDLIPFLKVLTGHNADKLKLNEEVNVKKIRVYFVVDPKDPFVSYIRDEMRNSFMSVVHHFKEVCETEPESLNLKGFRYAGQLWKYWMSLEETDFRKDLTDRTEKISAVLEVLKFLIGRSDHSGCTIMMLMNGILPIPNADWAKQETDKLKKAIIEKLGSNGVLLYPSAPFPATYHNAAYFRPWNFNLFNIWNSLKLPVTQVPLGLSKDGMPLGLQVVAAPYNDHLTIAVAKEIERNIGSYVPPFKILH